MKKTNADYLREHRRKKKLLEAGNVKFETYKPPLALKFLKRALRDKKRFFPEYDTKLREALEDLLKELSKYDG